ncbi:MAG: sulfatase family protein [Verrucomicrobiaceae bacterium]
MIARLLLPILLLGSTLAAEKPNIILFVSDDHGTEALGAYGNKVIKTPHLDAFAAQGVRFTNAYCTSASCAASRSVILTGQYGHATGSYGHVHDYHHFSTYDHVKSLPVLLNAAGYQTARIGKYHLAPESVYKFDHVLRANPRSTAEMADACQPILKQDAPFFLYFCPDDPHRGDPFTPDPWNAPNSFGNLKEGYPGVETITYDPKDVIVPPFLPDTPECRAELAEYYQSISRIDQGFGKLLAHLKAAGKTDNTVIIYISDNGAAFPGAKTTVYEPGIKLPCLVNDPRSPHHGLVNNAMITWADLTPTILDFADVEFNAADFHGRTFVPILGKPSPTGWDEIYAAHNFHELTMYYPMRVIRSGNYKLIWNIAYRLEYPFASDLWAASTWQANYRTKTKTFGPRTMQDFLFRAEFELYDLSTDPNESKNLAGEKAHAATLLNLKKKLKAFQLKTKDPWQISWSYETNVQGTGVGL